MQAEKQLEKVPDRRQGVGEERYRENEVFSVQISVSIESTFILLSSSSVLFSVSLQQNCNSGEMHSCLVELGAAGYIPVFETYQLLFIHPFVSVCNSARLGFFVSLSPQTVPRIRITEAPDLLQSYLFNEMHALLPYVPKRLLSGRKGL